MLEVARPSAVGVSAVLELATLATDVADEFKDTGLDACTLNNALNVAQLVAIVWLIRLLKDGAVTGSRGER